MKKIISSIFIISILYTNAFALLGFGDLMNAAVQTWSADGPAGIVAKMQSDVNSLTISGQADVNKYVDQFEKTVYSVGGPYSEELQNITESCIGKIPNIPSFGDMFSIGFDFCGADTIKNILKGIANDESKASKGEKKTNVPDTETNPKNDKSGNNKGSIDSGIDTITTNTGDSNYQNEKTKGTPERRDIINEIETTKNDKFSKVTHKITPTEIKSENDNINENFKNNTSYNLINKYKNKAYYSMLFSPRNIFGFSNSIDDEKIKQIWEYSSKIETLDYVKDKDEYEDLTQKKEKLEKELNYEGINYSERYIFNDFFNSSANTDGEIIGNEFLLIPTMKIVSDDKVDLISNQIDISTITKDNYYKEIDTIKEVINEFEEDPKQLLNVLNVKGLSPEFLSLYAYNNTKHAMAVAKCGSSDLTNCEDMAERGKENRDVALNEGILIQLVMINQNISKLASLIQDTNANTYGDIQVAQNERIYRQLRINELSQRATTGVLNAITAYQAIISQNLLNTPK